MHKLNSKLLMAAALAAALMAGCGGGGGFTNPPVVNTPGAGGGTGGGGVVADISKSVSDLFAFISGLIAGTSDMGDAIDINALTLATDDAVEPTPLN